LNKKQMNLFTERNNQTITIPDACRVPRKTKYSMHKFSFY
jgi:hypothetical protein